jgi:dTDP-4-amino-4,6-dideoxygalactose transaminase
MINVPFFLPTYLGNDLQDALTGYDMGNMRSRVYAGRTEEWLSKLMQPRLCKLTQSCTQSLELAALILGIKPGDEVIMPSFAFMSMGNAFALRGAKLVFVDIRPDTLNIDETKIEAAITDKTKVILTLNYAGVGCNYDAILPIAAKHNLTVVEDNAHGIMGKYKDKYLGSFGHISTLSFDFLKNITCGEGGAIFINDDKLAAPLRLAYEFGTNRHDFYEGKTPFYEWKGLGTNGYLSDISAAVLYRQLQNAEQITSAFKNKWKLYYNNLQPLQNAGMLSLPTVPPDCYHTAHNFYVITKSTAQRQELIDYLKQQGIQATFHYHPLHSSEFGLKAGVFSGQDEHTTRCAQQLVRLPLFYSLSEGDVELVCRKVYDFFGIAFKP